MKYLLNFHKLKDRSLKSFFDVKAEPSFHRARGPIAVTVTEMIDEVNIEMAPNTRYPS
jgi:hypothetical protein